MDLVRTRTGQRLHLRACPHMLAVTDAVVVPEAQAREEDICSWCRKEIHGVGRTPCASLDEAMRLFGTHPGTMARIREIAGSVEHDTIWLPHSRSYIALGRSGQGVAWIGKTVVVHRDGTVETFPGYQSGEGSRRTTDGEPRRGAVCPRCFLETAVSGVCANCA